jgi:DNA-binding GntR family transcriptional regulator
MKKAESHPPDQPLSVIDHAVKRLRGAIMVGDLRPGQKLIEADLCRELNISRASLREALRALEAERLIELVPNRGPSVARLGTKEIEDIHDLWALLTSEAVARFTELAAPKDIAEIDVITGRLRQALRTKNALDQLAATNDFFGFVFLKCGNAVLIDVITLVVSRLNFLRAQSLMHEGWSVRCSQEMDAIAAAIRSKKPTAARRATQRHIESACDAATHVAQLPRPSVSPRKQGTRIKPVEMARWNGRVRANRA